MKWAAVSFLALSALYAPAVAQAQQEDFTPRAIDSLRGLGESFMDCFPHRDPSAKLRIAVVEIATSPKFSDAAARIVTDRIETALENDPLFTIVPLRLSAELNVIRKEFQVTGPTASGSQLEGFITITPGADGNGQTSVTVTATTVDLACKRSAEKAVRVGEINDPPDDPEAFFRSAAKGLDERQIERLLVMPPEIGVGIGYGNASQGMAHQLQQQLAAAIRRTFKDRRLWRLSDDPIPAVGLYGDGTRPSGAWQARMRLNRSGRGIEVEVEFLSPGEPPRTVDSLAGHFQENVLPKNLDPPVLRMPALKTLKVNADPLEVEVEVLKGPSRLFCFFLEPNGEATLLYPQTLAGKTFTAGKMRFPNDFFDRMTRPWTVDDANDFFLHCAATRGPLSDDLQRLWLQNTVPERKKRNASDSVDPVMASEIISKLRQSDGYAEAFTQIVSK
jgi:hypothetical protein